PGPRSIENPVVRSAPRAFVYESARVAHVTICDNWLRRRRGTFVSMPLSNGTEEAIMNRMKAALIFCAVLLGATASAPALAWHHGRVHFGVVIGAPFYPWYYPPYPPYYYPPAVAVPVAPPTYVAQGGAQAAPS